MADRRTADESGPMRDITPVCDDPLVPRKLLYSGIATLAIPIAALIAVSV